MASDPVVGIDIGGTGIKGAPVDIAGGRFAAERVRLPTTPQAVADVVGEVLQQIGVAGPVGIALPAVGIGSALFADGTLARNSELGQLPLHHGEAEDRAAESIREYEHLPGRNTPTGCRPIWSWFSACCGPSRPARTGRIATCPVRTTCHT
jgi:hypothetical protein